MVSIFADFSRSCQVLNLINSDKNGKNFQTAVKPLSPSSTAGTKKPGPGAVTGTRAMTLFSARNIPNAITLCRIVLVPLLIRLLLLEDYRGALWVFLAAGISDALDGYIARRFDLCTRLGSFLDPIADKLLLVSSVVILARSGNLPNWLAATIVGRDVVIIGGAGAYYLRSGNLEMAPSMPGKLNTFIQICLVFSLILHLSGMARLAGLLPLLIAVAFVAALVSGGHYVAVWWRKAG
jgi:cardiolipin synthase